MADVDLQRPDLRERIDFVLASLEGFWGDLPGVVEEFGSWAPEDQIDFTTDELSSIDRLTEESTRYLERGAMTSDESERLESVRALAKERQPLLDSILAG